MRNNAVVIETYTSIRLLRGDDVAVYERIMDTLMAETADGDRTRRLILSAQRELIG